MTKLRTTLDMIYVHGLDLVSQNRGGNVSWYHYDGQHSTRQLSDASAQVTDTYNYDAFGLLLQRTGSTENDYMYTGEQYDPNVGFYYLRARYYNPEIGRFTTVDPWKGSIYDPASLHKYVYCNNDPMDYVDWSGEFSLTEIIIVTVITGILAACAAGNLGLTKGEGIWFIGSAMLASVLATLTGSLVVTIGSEAIAFFGTFVGLSFGIFCGVIIISLLILIYVFWIEGVIHTLLFKD